jgi:hypothetical protein
LERNSKGVEKKMNGILIEGGENMNEKREIGKDFE